MHNKSTYTLMARIIRASFLIWSPSGHTSTPITKNHNKLASAGFRTLHGPGTERHNYNGSLRYRNVSSSVLSADGTLASSPPSKSRAVGTSSSEGSLNYQDSTELETWKRGGGLFHVSADIDPTALIEAGAIVHAHAKVGPNVHLGSGTVVGPFVSIGSSTRIWYNVSLQNCFVGDFCLIHNGVCIGQDGFGHFVDGQGMMVKKPQLLYAKIGNHVEIGANTCIDRGSWRDTVIGDHTKIDNLVQIGHNVVVGRCCMLCGQVGIAGSVTIGDYVVMGGKSGAKDHVSVASKVRVAGLSIVTRNIAEPGDYAGFPAVPACNWRKSIIAMRKLSQQ